MKRGPSPEPPPEPPPGVPKDEWERYLAAKRKVRECAQRPRSSYYRWTEEDVAKCRAQNQLHFAPGKLGRLVPYTKPPSLHELFADDNTLWILNVKQPWATALVEGVKDVENRPRKFTGSRWVLIAASARQTTKYTNEAQRDMQRRLARSGQEAWQGRLRVDVYQHIIGVVKMTAYDFDEFTYEQRLSSVWYNGDYEEEDGTVLASDVALHLEQAFVFQTPIAFTKGRENMVRFKVVSEESPGLMLAVKNELLRLGAPAGLGPLDSDDDFDNVDPVDECANEAQPMIEGLTRPLPDLPPIPQLQTVQPPSQPISLNTWGCMAWTLDYPQEDVASFINELNAGAQEWMANHLARALTERPRKEEFAAGHQIWQSTEASIRQTILRYFDLRTHEGAIRLFDPSLRKASIPEPVRAYLNERLEYAKAGMNATAQGNSHKAWTLSGFGIWTRIWTSMGLKMLLQAKAMLKTVGFDTYPNGVPHIIYKPPRGSSLPAHHDQMPTKMLITKLEEHVSSADPTVEGWAKKHGVQLLAHIRGGYDDGFTYTVGPLDCQKLLYCMQLILDTTQDDIQKAAWSKAQAAPNKYNAFVNASSGPYFVDWYKLVGKNGDGPLNKRLRERGYTPLSIVPIRPLTNHNEPYLAMWPVGFPHGSMSNQEPRVTLTMNLTLKKVELAPRVIERLKNLATLAHTGSTDAEVAAAEAAFQADTTPYHDGGAHKMPEMMADLQRNAAYAVGGKAVGPFASIAPTREDVNDFVNALSAL